MSLADLLNPISIKSFFDNSYTKSALHILGPRGKLASVFSFTDLSHILNSARIPPPALRLFKGGEPISCDDPVSILSAIQDGATMILDRVDSYFPDLRRQITAWSYEFGEPLQVNMYLSQPDKQGFVKHYDKHDVLVLQISGFKQWRVFAPTNLYPLRYEQDHREKSPVAPYLDAQLSPGSILYVPRGHWHEATARSEPSLHLTVGIKSRTAIDYCTWLLNGFEYDEMWRQNLLPPTLHSMREALRDDSFVSRLQQLKQAVSSAIDSAEHLTAFDAFTKVSVGKSFMFDLPNQMRSNPVSNLRLASFERQPGQQVFVSNQTNNGHIHIAVEGHQYILYAAASTLVHLIFTKHKFSGSDLLTQFPAIPESMILELLNLLVVDGVIKCRSATPGCDPADVD